MQQKIPSKKGKLMELPSLMTHPAGDICPKCGSSAVGFILPDVVKCLKCGFEDHLIHKCGQEVLELEDDEFEEEVLDEDTIVVPRGG
jgi:hypothetical protein